MRAVKTNLKSRQFRHSNEERRSPARSQGTIVGVCDRKMKPPARSSEDCTRGYNPPPRPRLRSHTQVGLFPLRLRQPPVLPQYLLESVVGEGFDFVALGAGHGFGC